MNIITPEFLLLKSKIKPIFALCLPIFVQFDQKSSVFGTIITTNLTENDANHGILTNKETFKKIKIQ